MENSFEKFPTPSNEKEPVKDDNEIIESKKEPFEDNNEVEGKEEEKEGRKLNEDEIEEIKCEDKWIREMVEKVRKMGGRTRKIVPQETIKIIKEIQKKMKKRGEESLSTEDWENLKNANQEAADCIREWRMTKKEKEPFEDDNEIIEPEKTPEKEPLKDSNKEIKGEEGEYRTGYVSLRKIYEKVKSLGGRVVEVVNDDEMMLRGDELWKKNEEEGLSVEEWNEYMKIKAETKKRLEAWFTRKKIKEIETENKKETSVEPEKEEQTKKEKSSKKGNPKERQSKTAQEIEKTKEQINENREERRLEKETIQSVLNFEDLFSVLERDGKKDEGKKILNFIEILRAKKDKKENPNFDNFYKRVDGIRGSDGKLYNRKNLEKPVKKAKERVEKIIKKEGEDNLRKKIEKEEKKEKNSKILSNFPEIRERFFEFVGAGKSDQETQDMMRKISEKENLQQKVFELIKKERNQEERREKLNLDEKELDSNEKNYFLNKLKDFLLVPPALLMKIIKKEGEGKSSQNEDSSKKEDSRLSKIFNKSKKVFGAIGAFFVIGFGFLKEVLDHEDAKKGKEAFFGSVKNLWEKIKGSLK